jgi:hypothetical protein
MRNMRIIGSLVAVGLLAALIGGCTSMGTIEIHDAKEANIHILAYLEKKYGEPFLLMGNEIKNTVINDCYIYGADYAPESDPSKVFEASVNSYGSGSNDNYGMWVFKEEVEALCSDVLDEKDYIEHYTVKLTMSPTASKWEEGERVEAFLGSKSIIDPYNRVDVWLEGGLTDEKYAEQIKDIIDEYYDLPCAVEIQVQAADMVIFFYKFQAGKTYRYTTERIVEDIVGLRQIHEMMNRAAENENE